MSDYLETYLLLEREVLRLDDKDDPLADVLRDAMDPVWGALDEAERARLNARGMMTSEDGTVKAPLTDVFIEVDVLPEPHKTSTIMASDWEIAA